MMALGEERSAEVFKYLQEDEIEALAREIAALGTVPPDVGEPVLDEFTQMTDGRRSHRHRRRRARPPAARRSRSAPSRRAASSTASSRRSTASAGFASLEKANPQQLSKFILGEHPQTIALILAHLNAGSAAQLVDAAARRAARRRADADGEPRRDLARRHRAHLERHRPAAASRSAARRASSTAASARWPSCSTASIAASASARSRRIEERSPDLAVPIRNLMFVFDDLASVEDTGIREIVNRADKKALTVALKGASEEIRDALLRATCRSAPATC